MTPTLTLRADTRQVATFVRDLQRELDRLAHLRGELMELLFNPGYLGLEMPSVDGRRRAAGRANELTIRPQPSNELLAALLALRTFNRDLGAIHRRLKIKHDGTSGAATGEVKRSHRRAGGRRRQARQEGS